MSSVIRAAVSILVSILIMLAAVLYFPMRITADIFAYFRRARN
jgi:hypothetical protein